MGIGQLAVAYRAWGMEYGVFLQLEEGDEGMKGKV
jgi:hypothetical protein